MKMRYPVEKPMWNYYLTYNKVLRHNWQLLLASRDIWYLLNLIIAENISLDKSKFEGIHIELNAFRPNICNYMKAIWPLLIQFWLR